MQLPHSDLWDIAHFSRLFDKLFWFQALARNHRRISAEKYGKYFQESMSPVEEQPYAEYTVKIQADGFEAEEIAGTEVLPKVTSEQPVNMLSKIQTSNDFERIVIPPHTLFYAYPPKIQEAEIKPVNDNQAKNYYVRYKDYIKNVASSEIYATWSDDSIWANVLAIMFFTLNRVYTETTTNPGLQKRYS